MDYKFEADEIDTSRLGLSHKYEIPNMLYAPENIFANNIAALDVNFLRPNTYQSVYGGGEQEFSEDAQKASESGATKIRDTIANWYKSFRNIAIVALLSILIYLGIRILIGSTAEDKAKYKEAIKDWVVALCLVFFMQFIISAILMVSEQITELFSNEINEGYVVQVGNDAPFKTNLMGLVRFRAQSKSTMEVATYTLIYGILVVYTCVFTFMYYKRLLYVAFFTMISPLVAVTYPIDKYGDGKAQALNMVLRELVENIAMQPIHLIIYRALITPAIAGENPIYSIVAIGFVIPAYKWFTQILDGGKSQTAKGGGSPAMAALAMSGMQTLSKLGAGAQKKLNGKGSDSKESDDSNDDIFMPRDDDGELKTFGGEPNDGEEGATGDGTAFSGKNDNGMNQEENGNQPGYDFDEAQQAEIDRQLKQDMLNATYGDFDNAGGRSEYEKQRKEELEKEMASGNWSHKQESKFKQTKRKIANHPMTRFLGRGAKAGLKTGGKAVLKGSMFAARKGTQLGMAATGAALGGIIAVGTGQPEKAIQNMITGGVAGNMIGRNAANAIGSIPSGVSGIYEAGKNTADNIENAYNEEFYGYNKAREMRREKQNEKARKDFYKDSKQIRKCRSMASEISGYTGNLKDVQDAVFDMKQAGITDDKLITNTLKAEYARDGKLNGKNHEKFVDAASFSHQQGIGYKDIAESKSREKVETMIQGKVSGSKAQGEAERMIFEIFGAGKTYEQHGKLGKPQPQQKSQPKSKPQSK